MKILAFKPHPRILDHEALVRKENRRLMREELRAALERGTIITEKADKVLDTDLICQCPEGLLVTRDEPEGEIEVSSRSRPAPGLLGVGRVQATWRTPSAVRASDTSSMLLAVASVTRVQAPGVPARATGARPSRHPTTIEASAILRVLMPASPHGRAPLPQGSEIGAILATASAAKSLPLRPPRRLCVSR